MKDGTTISALAALSAGWGLFILSFSDSAEASLSSFDRWRAECKVDSLTDQTSCNVMYAKLGNGYIGISLTQIEGKFIFAISTDHGILEGCAIRVDAEKAITSDITYQGICLMGPGVIDTQKIMDDFLVGESVLVRVYLYGKGYEETRIPLQGFEDTVKEANW